MHYASRSQLPGHERKHRTRTSKFFGQNILYPSSAVPPLHHVYQTRESLTDCASPNIATVVKTKICKYSTVAIAAQKKQDHRDLNYTKRIQVLAVSREPPRKQQKHTHRNPHNPPHIPYPPSQHTCPTLPSCSSAAPQQTPHRTQIRHHLPSTNSEPEHHRYASKIPYIPSSAFGCDTWRRTRRREHEICFACYIRGIVVPENL